METFIEICLITVNKQPVEDDHVEEFIELLETGKVLPPVVLRRSGEAFVLIDGRHRFQANKRLGRTHIKARITL